VETFHLAWFEASAAVQMRSSLFSDVTQRRLVVSYWRFEKIYRSHLRGSPLEMGSIGCP
jgi:hypothetical protein